jgi:hypothetical protein
MGNSGEPYEVVVDEEISCSCPDHTTRGNLCKHLLFVLIRAIGMNERTVMEQYYSVSTFVTSDETIGRCQDYIGRRAQGLTDINFVPNPIAGNADLKPAKPVKPAVERRPYQDQMCPICCEDFESNFIVFVC